MWFPCKFETVFGLIHVVLKTESDWHGQGLYPGIIHETGRRGWYLSSWYANEVINSKLQKEQYTDE